MTWPVPLDLEPMEAMPVDRLPDGPEWAYEPKYDGFRCLAFRNGEAIVLQSRRQRPLGRFFPEMVSAIRSLAPDRFVLDGELVIEGAEFDTLQLRLHPAASRIAKLSRENPATFIAFDLLSGEDGRALLDAPFERRRSALNALFKRVGAARGVRLAKGSRSRTQAERWLSGVGHGLDGIVAKRLDLPYQPGRRAMLKYKVWHTVDCVVGGVYLKRGTQRMEYLLLGLYNPAGRLDYVGRCPAPEAAEQLLHPLMGKGGFTGEAPGGPSRWSDRVRTPVPVAPRLVVEVSADHVTAGKFRHGARLLRWRDDKDPHSCTADQLNSLVSAKSL